MDEQKRLRRAVDALERQRARLGDDVADTALAPLRARLAELQAADAARSAAVAGPSAAAGAAAVVPAGPQARRNATILLADLAGFSAFAHQRDAEELGDLLDALWRRLDSVIATHGGVIDKHIGDGVMAVWGARRASEDDPEQAVRAAMRMQEAMAVFRVERNLPLQMRIGVSTGPVLLGEFGTTGEFSVLGDAVNFSQRLEQAAQPGGVLISHDTYRQVRGLFDMVPQSKMAVKGWPEAMRSYSVLRAKPHPFYTRARGVEGIDTRMIGRERELATMQRTFERIAEGGGAGLLTVLGDAGVGKSRLLSEFEQWLDLHPLTVRRFAGRGRAATQTKPFVVVRDMLAGRFAILDTDRPATAQAKLRDGLSGALQPGEADVVGHAIGFDLSGSRAVRELLGSPSFGRLAVAHLHRYFAAVAAEPTVVLIDDAHWADDTSLDFLERLIEDLPGSRLLVICLARQNLIERRPDWGVKPPGDVGRRDRLRLGALSEEATRELIDEILRRLAQVPQTLRDLVVERAEGNPFYVEEIIKLLIEDGVIVPGPDRWILQADRLGATAVPSTLTAVLQARLDALPHKERLLLQRAAVVGRSFWDSAVCDLVEDEVPAREIGGLVADLCRRELIHPCRPATFAGTREYSFKHALLRDVAYEMVLRKQRRALHARVAGWLERHAGARLGEHLALIAAHYEQAGDRSMAGRHLGRHSRELVQVGAYRAAIEAGLRALSLVPADDAQPRAEVEVAVGEAYRLLGAFTEARVHLQIGLDQATRAGAPGAAVAALNGLALAARVQGDDDTASRLLNEALLQASACGDRRGMVVSHHNLGDLAYRQGNAAEAAHHAGESLTLARSMRDRQGAAAAMRVLGFAALLRGDFAAADRYQARSRATYERIGDCWGVVAGSINLGENARKQGRFAEAVAHFRDAQAIAGELQARYEVGLCDNNLGHVYIGLGEFERAREHLCRALALSLDLGTLPVVLESLVGIADLRANVGAYGPAAELLGLVIGHAGYTNEVARYTERTLAALRARLAPAVLEAALAQGRGADLAGVVAEIVGGANGQSGCDAGGRAAERVG